MMMESISEDCVSVFAHDEEDLSEAFTRLWAQIINKKEAGQNQDNVAKADMLDL